MNQNISHRNHYIPQFYLKNWSLDGRTIQTYSILVSNENVPYWTKQSIKNTAVWNDFYTRVVGVEELDDFEHWFDREFESPAKPILDKLISGAKLSREEHKALSRFVFAVGHANLLSAKKMSSFHSKFHSIVKIVWLK